MECLWFTFREISIISGILKNFQTNSSAYVNDYEIKLVMIDFIMVLSQKGFYFYAYCCK